MKFVCPCGHLDQLVIDLSDMPDFHVCDNCERKTAIRGENPERVFREYVKRCEGEQTDGQRS